MESNGLDHYDSKSAEDVMDKLNAKLNAESDSKDWMTSSQSTPTEIHLQCQDDGQTLVVANKWRTLACKGLSQHRRLSGLTHRKTRMMDDMRDNFASASLQQEEMMILCQSSLDVPRA